MNTVERALAVVVGGAVAFAAVLFPLVGQAYTPLEVGGAVARWSTSTVTFGIGWDVDEAWDGAARGAFAAWDAELTGISLQEDPALRGQTNIGGASHLVVYDPDNGTGWFTDTSFVAVTPIWADGGGNIIDADIVLNGRDHSFSTDGSSGTFDVQAILTHEVGHFVGFDHSGVRGASLYPYVSTADPTPRSLSSDDRAAAASLTPAGHTRLTGLVTRADSSPLRGAQLIAVDAGGHALATAVTGADGRYDLVGLDAGTQVRVFAAPFDGPVSASNLLLSGVEADFQTTEHPGGPFSVSAGGQADLGTIVCGAKTVSITGLWASPIEAGSSGTVTVTGVGLDPSDTTWSLLGPGGVSITQASEVGGGATWYLTVAADANAALGLRTLVATRPGKLAVEPGCVEVTGATPTVSSVSPATAEPGDMLTVDGSGFLPGAEVRVGGLPAGHVQWLDGARLRCTAPAAQGLAGVTVINPDGLSAQKASAVSFDPTPEAPSPDAPPPPPTGNTNSGPSGPSQPPGNSPTSSGGARSSGGGGGGGGGCSLAGPLGSSPGAPLAWLGLLLGLLALRARPRGA